MNNLPPLITTIDEQFHDKIYVQSYEKQKVIEGVKVVEIPNFVGEDSDFSELIRLDEQGELTHFPGFKLRQVNRTRMIGHSIKGWHLHFKQNEIWYLMPNFQMLVGLWDLRKDSPTCGATMRIVLGGGKSQLLFIPKGVAHGSHNLLGESSNMLYFVDQQFSLQEPDELRIHWDTLGKEFWDPQRD